MTRITLVFIAILFNIVGIWFVWAAIATEIYKNRMLIRTVTFLIGILLIYQSVVIYLG